MCKEGVPLAKFKSLMTLLKLLQVPNISALHCTENCDYTSSISVDGFLKVLSDLIDENIVKKIKASPVITVFVDESTDIVIHHKLAINTRVVDPLTLQPSTFFLTDVRLHNATGAGIFEAIKHELDKRDIDMLKVYGLGTDGASTMTGQGKGLTGHFLRLNPHIKNTHCSAHRVALVSEQAAQKVKNVQEFSETVKSIYKFFQQSPKQSDALEEIQKVLDEPILRCREVHAIRWLSFFLALETVYRTLDSLITLFETNSATNAKANGLKKKVGQELFIKLTYCLLDWLQPIMRLGQYFQKQDIDLSVAKVNVDFAIKDMEKMRDADTSTDCPLLFYTQKLDHDLHDGIFKGHRVAKNAAHFENVKTQFLQNMIDNLKARFPDSETMSRFAVFGMRSLQFLDGEALDVFGNEDIQVVADFYCNRQSHTYKKDDKTTAVSYSEPFLQCSPADVLREWERCKLIVKSNRLTGLPLSYLWESLAKLQEEGSLDCPNLIKLATLVLTHPVHSCDCERTFSVQNLTLTSLRSRLSPEKCDQLMRVKIEGGELADFDFEAAIARWSECRRKIFTSKK